MKPFFGVDNRISSIIISLILFVFSIYTLLSEGILNLEQISMIRLRAADSQSGTQNGKIVSVRYSFESTSASLFGLYEVEISMIIASVSFLLFVVLLVGATQRSKILLRIWMMIDAVVVVLGFLSSILSLTANHIHFGGTPPATLLKYFVTAGFCLWFFSVVLSLHEEIEMRAQHPPGEIQSCKYVAKKDKKAEEKCPPYFDC